MFPRVFLLLLAPFALLVCEAQEKTKDPPRTLRILAVGDSPPFRQEIRNGIRYELPPPEGSVPPARVQIGVSDEEGKKKQSEVENEDPKKAGLPLRLNDISRQLTVPNAAVTVRLLVEGRSWHSLELPEGGNYLAILWREPKAKSWEKARSILVRDGGSRFAAGTVRFINIGPAAVGFTVGEGERIEVRPGKVAFEALGFSQGTPAQALYQDPKRGWRRFWSSALVQNRGERSTVVVYFADGEKPRRPLKLIALRERAVALPKERPPEG